MDTFSYFLAFCQRLVNAFVQLVDPVLDFCETSLYTILRRLADAEGEFGLWSLIAEFVKGTTFGDTPVLFALLGAGFITYITYAIVKWFLDVVL